jgi:hypothetical protein
VRISSWNFDSWFCCVYSCSEKKNQGRFRHVGSDHSLVRNIEPIGVTFLTFWVCQPDNWVVLFLGDINKETRTSSIGDSRIGDGKCGRVPRDSDLRMTVLARGSNNCKRQTHPLVKEDVIKGLCRQLFSWKKNNSCESRGACRQDELIGGKPLVVK